ncbi:MAG: SgcJ/EcaC family oxidoreductase [Paracoccaceae bacterium]
MLAHPQDMPAAFAAAWAARDASALAMLFAPDADFVNVTGIWWQSRSAIETAHDYGLTTIFPDSTLTTGRIKTRLTGSDAATVHCRFHLTGQTAPDGTTADPRHTIMLFVMAKTPQGWHCIAAQNTDIIPRAETHVATGTTRTPTDYRT